MKALVLRKPGDFDYEERPEPQCPPGYVTIRVDAVSICGSDNHAIRGNMPMFTFPRVIGHEVCGTVRQVGTGVTELAEGDRVCLMPCIPCGNCRACKKGKTNACRDLRLYGVHEDGGLQEYFSAPAEHFLKVPAGATAEEVSILEPLTIGAHAVAKLNLEEGDRVLIIGSGPIGVSCAVNAQTWGAEVTMADTSEDRRNFASRRFGLKVLDPRDAGYEQELLQITEDALFDAVIDTTAVKASMDHCWKWITQGGKIVFVGICNGTLELDGKNFHAREPSLFVTRNSTIADYRRVLRLWQEGKLVPGAFVTHRVPFEQAAGVLTKWAEPNTGVFKGVVTFSEHAVP